MFKTLDLFDNPDLFPGYGAALEFKEMAVKDLVKERAFPGAGNSG